MSGRPSDSQSLAVTLIGLEQCQALYQGDAPMADFSVHTPPVTERAWHRFYGQQPVANPDPWWLDCNDGPDAATAVAWVAPSLSYFAGHFPGAPILPGVVQVNWATALADRLLSGRFPRDAFAGLARVKFKAAVLPGALLQYELGLSQGRIRLRIVSKDGVHTEGQLLYRG